MGPSSSTRFAKGRCSARPKIEKALAIPSTLVSPYRVLLGLLLGLAVHLLLPTDTPVQSLLEEETHQAMLNSVLPSDWLEPLYSCYIVVVNMGI